MKSYTDTEQSKKLAEILPLESADMRYEAYYVSPKEDIIEYENHPHFAKCIENCIPCWSLAALLELLPDKLVINDTVCIIDIYSYDDSKHITYVNVDELDESVMGFSGESYVDAAFEMVCWLKKNKYI